MIPFAVTIPEDERDPQLVEKLKAEWPGILQWMIDGCLDWQEMGLAPPEAVTKATDAYFAGEDGFADWIAERCEEVRGHWSRSSDLFASWRDYAEKAGLQAGDTKQFNSPSLRGAVLPTNATKEASFSSDCASATHPLPRRGKCVRCVSTSNRSLHAPRVRACVRAPPNPALRGTSAARWNHQAGGARPKATA